MEGEILMARRVTAAILVMIAILIAGALALFHRPRAVEITASPNIMQMSVALSQYIAAYDAGIKKPRAGTAALTPRKPALERAQHNLDKRQAGAMQAEPR
jgi:hypothetical protein